MFQSNRALEIGNRNAPVHSIERFGRAVGWWWISYHLNGPLWKLSATTAQYRLWKTISTTVRKNRIFHGHSPIFISQIWAALLWSLTTPLLPHLSKTKATVIRMIQGCILIQISTRKTKSLTGETAHHPYVNIWASRLSRWIGPIDWKEDEINSSSAETALLESSIASYDPGYRDSVKSLKADIWVLDGKQLYQAWEYGIRSFPQSQRAIYPTETKATLL